MRLAKVFRIVDKDLGPKQALTPDQWPLEVENPTTGEMVKTAPEKEGKGDKSEIKDATEETKIQLYRQLKRFVPEMLKFMYPTYLQEGGTIDDAISQIYLYVTRPRTSKEDIEKLKAEDAKSGKTHSDSWYRYEQTKYPKASQLDWFDEDQSSIEGFSHTVAKQGIIRMMKADRSLTRGEDGAFRKTARFSSMDADPESADEDAVNETRLAAESKASTSQSHIDVADWIKRFRSLGDDALEGAINRLRGVLESGALSPADEAKFRQIIKAVEPKKPSSLRSDGTPRTKWGTGKRRSSMALIKKMSEDTFPFNVEPQEMRAADHSSRLKFTFGSRKEAEAEAEKHNEEMEQMGWKFVKVQGTSILYTLDGE